MDTSLGYGGYREPLCGNRPENGQQQFNQTMTALVHKNYALCTENTARIFTGSEPCLREHETTRRSATDLGCGCIVRGQNNVCWNPV